MGFFSINRKETFWRKEIEEWMKRMLILSFIVLLLGIVVDPAWPHIPEPKFPTGIHQGNLG
ncbi:MAG: hypothetical protein D6805_02315 [Planctomycetota bacterium]|nr:MAG: hypothetical protein D6805_02315 [Planctomycetota bacterium]